MNNNLKLMLATIGGAGAGAFITYTLMKEKYESLINNEIEAMRIFYEDRAEKKEEEEPDLSMGEDLREASSIVDIKQDLKDYKHYAGAYSKVVKVVEEEETPDEYDYHQDDYDEMDSMPLPFEPRTEIDRNTPPFTITFEEYVTTMDWYDKIDLVYFRDDDVLVDDQDEMIDNVDWLIGEDNLMTFGNDPEDENCIHIRNHKMAADFEIVRNHASYKEWVLGEEN